MKWSVTKGVNDLATVCPDLIDQWNVEKNGSVTLDMFGKASKEVVWWTCPACGHEYQARISSRTYRKSGCPVCANQAVKIGINDLSTLFPDIASQWDIEKNGDLRPEMFTKGSEKRVWWRCECGNEWETSIKNRTQGRGCPKCAEKSQTSHPEQAILFYLKKLPFGATGRFRADWFTTGGRSTGLELDIYFPTLCLGIEYDGDTYHADAGKDSAKNALCEKLGIDLIRVREPECPETEKFGCVEIILKNKKTPALEEAIRKIIEMIGNRTNRKFDVDVDLSRDWAEICYQTDSSKKSNSLSLLNPELAECWDPCKNGSLTPDNVSVGSHTNVWWICSSCGVSRQTAVCNASRKKTYLCKSCAGKVGYAS